MAVVTSEAEIAADKEKLDSQWRRTVGFHLVQQMQIRRRQKRPYLPPDDCRKGEVPVPPQVILLEIGSLELYPPPIHWKVRQL